MYGYYAEPGYFIFLIVSLAVTLYAQVKVKNAFNKYSKIGCHKPLTGRDAANEVLNYNQVQGVSIYQTAGSFSDYYDSRTKGVYLSESVYSKTSLAAVGVAAHECGHATQDYQNYIPLKIRHFLVPVTQLSSKLAMPLIFIGFLLPTKYQFIVNVGIMFFSLAVLFELITLPVEFDASRRALKALRESKMLTQDELKSAKKMLTAAAMTYLASAFTALLSLIRLLLIARNRRD